MTTDISVAPQKPPAPKRAPFYTSMFFWLLVAIVSSSPARVSTSTPKP
ncbi:hypothetical protein M2359_002315 [Gordonia amarae]|nr:hypothetical protein [Gordonia amarae]